MSTSVVQTRCTLLQALLDDLLTQPPLCFQPEVGSLVLTAAHRRVSPCLACPCLC